MIKIEIDLTSPENFLASAIHLADQMAIDVDINVPDLGRVSEESKAWHTMSEALRDLSASYDEEYS